MRPAARRFRMRCPVRRVQPPLKNPCVYDTQWQSVALLLHPSAGWVSIATKASVSFEFLELNLQNLTRLSMSAVYDDERDHDTFGEGYTIHLAEFCIGGSTAITDISPSAVPITGGSLVTLHGPILAPSYYHECEFRSERGVAALLPGRYDAEKGAVLCSTPRWVSHPVVVCTRGKCVDWRIAV